MVSYEFDILYSDCVIAYDVDCGPCQMIKIDQ